MSKKFLLGTLFGATVGATLAFLFAPKSGEELREDLVDKTQDLKATVLDYVELATIKSGELKQVAAQKTEDISVSINEGVQELKSQFHQFRQAKEAIKEDAVDKIENVSEEISTQLEDVNTPKNA